MRQILMLIHDLNKEPFSKVEMEVNVFKVIKWGFPVGTVGKNLPANAGDTGSSPGLGRSHMLQSN